MKTKLNKEKVEKVRDQCNFEHSWVVPSIGRSGGLVLFWKDGVTIEVLSEEQSHIDTLVKGRVLTDWWHLTSFYGALETSRRDESWALLKVMRDRSNLPWLAIDNFNEITSGSEKEGGSFRPR